MGQYYKLTCPETGTHVDASNFGSFVKAYEQIWSTSQPAAMAFLCSAGRGAHPRDLPWAPQGLWAGRMPLMVGDYAENGDLRGRETQMGQPEEKIYENATEKQATLGLGGKRKKLMDLTEALIPIYERVTGMRAADLNADGTTVPGMKRFGRDFFPAKKTATGWEINLDDVEEDQREELRGYYERCGAFDNSAWKREAVRPGAQSFYPLADVPDVIPSEEEGQGTAMIWVNLDRREFIDPAAMGDVPDLVGVMTGLSARAVLGMIVHHARRGGGDLGDLGPVNVPGRWRGDRIVLLGPESFKPSKGKTVTQAEVRAEFLDITRNAEAFIKCGDWFGTENFEMQGDPVNQLTPEEKEILAIAMRAPAVRASLEDVSANCPLHATLTPPVRIKRAHGGSNPPEGPIDLAGSIEIYVNGGKIFLDADTRAQVNAKLMALPRKEVELQVKPGNFSTRVSCPANVSSEAHFRSNHEIIGAFNMPA